MSDSDLPTPDIAGKRRRRLLLRKRLYQRLWGGRASNETPVIVFLAGTPDIGNGYVINALESNFDTDVYRAKDPRAFEGLHLRGDDVLRELIGRSRASCIVFVTGGESAGVAPLIERFSPARVLWFYETCERFMARAARVLDEADTRDFLHGRFAGREDRLSTELTSLIETGRLESATVWALAWYAIHDAYRQQRLGKRSAAHLIGEHTLMKAPAATMDGLCEIIGAGSGQRRNAPRLRSRRVRGKRAALPEVVQTACDELQGWLDAHAEDPADRS